MSEITKIAFPNVKLFHSFLFKKLPTFDEFFDVFIWAEDKVISAHRIVLALGSSVFQKMLKDAEGLQKQPVRK